MSMKVNLMSQSNEVQKNDRGMSKVHKSHSEESTARKTWDSMRSKSTVIGTDYTPLNKLSF